jgi:hypothetical protein
MASHIERRKFLATLGGAAAWPLAARAQQVEQLRKIGLLAGGDTVVFTEAFREQLQKLGWTDEGTGVDPGADIDWIEIPAVHTLPP